MTLPPLADTSAWVDALRRKGTLIERLTAQGHAVGYTPPVLAELLAGCRSDAEAWNVRRLLIRGAHLSFDVATDFEAAADVYRHARRAGLTANSLIDCMIVAVAARHEAELITLDVQQGRIAELFGVSVLR